jgi:citrate lyase beta subunit
MNSINYLELGATMFVPATHKNLESIVLDEKYPNLKSVLIDTEDGIGNTDLVNSLDIIKKLLKKYKRKKLLVFIRPKDIETLKEIIFFDGVTNIAGFILPKFSLENAKEYLDILEAFDFFIMPSVEGDELFDNTKLIKLCDTIKSHKTDVSLVRIGLEDMLKSLRMKRKCDKSLFDISATSFVLGNFISTFKSKGFAISGGVYPCFDDIYGFVEDVERDLVEGMITKTIIHPNQIDPAHELYKVTQEEFDDALEIIQSDEAVFAQSGKMAETITMLPYAKEVVYRAEFYGIKNR